MKQWYEKWFSNKYYLKLYRHRDEKEASNLINLIQRSIPVCSGAKVLDICCGSGRHSIELARRGYEVTGFDLSEYLISEAERTLSKANEQNLKVNFMVKNMLDFDFEKRFDFAINIFSSFGYFTSDSDNFKVFDNVKKSIKHGGYFVFDFLNKNFVKKSLIPYSEDYIDGVKVIQKRWIDNGFVYKDIIINNEIYQERIRLYGFEEIQNALIQNGLKTDNFYGDYYGGVFSSENSKRMVFITKG